MKTILLLLGPNGIGKSTTAKCILDKLPNAALVDSEWCRAMNPYDMDTVVNNLYALMKNYLLCPEIEVIVFPYGFHGDRKQRYDIVIDKLRGDKMDFSEFTVILTCSYEENIARLQNDMRDMERINRGMKNTFHFYDEYNFPKIDTTNLTVTQTADEIIKLFINKEKPTSKRKGTDSETIDTAAQQYEIRSFVHVPGEEKI